MDNYAIVENSICINVIFADADFAKSIGAVALAAGYGIGDRYNDGEWEKGDRPKPTPAPPTAQEQQRADIDYLAAMVGVQL